jgi:hypothetical protein
VFNGMGMGMGGATGTFDELFVDGILEVRRTIAYVATACALWLWLWLSWGGCWASL